MTDNRQSAKATAKKHAYRTRYRQAIRRYERLHESEPDDAGWLTTLCQLYAQSGDYQAAYDRITAFQEHDQGAEWNRCRAILLHLLGRSDEAFEIYPLGEVEALTPLRQTVERLVLTWRAGRSELAQQVATEVERLQNSVPSNEMSNVADLYLLWVLMAIQATDWEEAAQRCQAGIDAGAPVRRFAKVRVECMIEAADAAFRRRDTRQAIALWEAVRKDDPFDEIATTNRAVAMLRLGLAYLETGAPERAISLWEEVRRGEALDGYAAFNLALLSAHMGRTAEAAQYAAGLRIAWDVPKEIEGEVVDAPEQQLIRSGRGYAIGAAAYRTPRRTAINTIQGWFGDSWWLDGLFSESSPETGGRRRERGSGVGSAANRRRERRRRRR